MDPQIGSSLQEVRAILAYTLHKTLTFVQYVARVSKVAVVTMIISARTLERSLTNVLSVGKAYSANGTWQNTYLGTQGRNHASVMCVVRCLPNHSALGHIEQFMGLRSQTNQVYVINDLSFLKVLFN